MNNIKNLNQKFIGIILIILVLFSIKITNYEATHAVFLIPCGIYALVTEKDIIK